MMCRRRLHVALTGVKPDLELPARSMDVLKTTPTSGIMTSASVAPVILWFRDDLRLADHAALHAAVETGRPILPVFILDDVSSDSWALGGASRWWLHYSLVSLQESLMARGSGLTLRRGDSVKVITELADHVGAAEVFTGGSAEPWERRADQAASEALEVPLHRMRTATLFHPDSVRTKTGGAYSVYTPFANACLALGGPKQPVSAPKMIHAAKPPAPISWKIGACCPRSRTGRAACGTLGLPARPERWNGRRRS